eukprot:TRINITY_DN7931_c0_g1_i1.p1 TRINITY_DN7931_c0_g1~~TRINITY_DN7931_c0_g1_i1.p1  ORF type:complete len:469 (-),score=66.40 TRINITY_DN7931_c0_g1_i1:4-1410(-)
MTLLYHPNEDGTIQIVGFEVSPFSVRWNYMEWSHQNLAQKCPSPMKNEEYLHQSVTPVPEGEHILWTYSVQWKESDITQVQFMNTYTREPQGFDSNIHWSRIVRGYSLVIVATLSCIAAIIIVRANRANVRHYNQIDYNEEIEEAGWKLISGDVFRPPVHPMLFSVLVGTGVQVFAAVSFTIVLALFGYLSPAGHGIIATGTTLFNVMGFLAGYFSTRTYKTFHGQNWKANALVTALGFSGVVFGTFLVLNKLLQAQQSSSAVPFPALLQPLSRWLGVCVILVFCGSYLAFKTPRPEDPVPSSRTPRAVPKQPWTRNPVLFILVGGLPPVSAVFLDLHYILGAVWRGSVYPIMGYLGAWFVLLVLTCAEVAIIMCHIQLCDEDYHWWWRSYLTAGASGLYIFLYSTYYFFTYLNITYTTTPVSWVLYFGCSFLMALCFFVLTGFIGQYACSLFVHRLYTSWSRCLQRK